MNRTRSLFCQALLVALACCSLVAVTASAAQAAFGIASFGAATSINGEASRQAGAHADLRTGFDFNVDPATGHIEGNVKDLHVDIPLGAVGNPTAVPKCPTRKLLKPSEPTETECPPETQIGRSVVRFGQFTIDQPVFNMQHSSESPGLFAMNVFSAGVYVSPTVRPGDYGISALSARTSQAEPIEVVDFTLWGVPYDHGTGVQERRPFMTNTTSCVGPVPFHIEANSWLEPEGLSAKTVFSDFDGEPFEYSGCERLGFKPTLEIQPGSHRAHSPSGLGVDIAVPQNEGPDGLATAHVRKVVTTFPKGLTLSSSTVAGLEACSLAQVGIGSNDPPNCPNAAKLGGVTVRSQLLDDPLEGEIVLARQNENPFNSTFAIYLLAKGPGFYIKVPGRLEVDKQSGQLQTIFDDLPQLPFEEAHLDFRGGPTAPLQTPSTCGTYNTHTEITSWASAKAVVIDTPMRIDEDCTSGASFTPGLQAGVANPVAGAYSPFTLRVTRTDGEQNISRIDATLPEGELAKLAGLGVCSEAQAVIGACPASSQVGIATAAIGIGAFPLFVPQAGKDPTALYLGGPYKGAPYSLVAKVPAQTGPFDFGIITVRSAIDINPITAQATVKSDPLPQIIEGVPIQYRDVRVEVQKPDFTLNPTSCEQRRVRTTITSIEGMSANPSVPFKVGDCSALGFAPRLAFKLSGGTRRGQYPALTATLTTRKGDANIARAAVTLPHSEFLAQSHIKTICTRVQFAARTCPAGSIYGNATAITPLLDKPLSGPVYLRSSSNPLPDLVAVLNGQFEVELAGRIDSDNAGIRNTFDFVPDAPVSKFVLRMQGAKKGLLENSKNLCAGKAARAEVKLAGQNGKRSNTRSVVVPSSCGTKAKKKSKSKRANKSRRASR